MPPEDPYQYFRIEAREILDRIGRELLELEKDGARNEAVQRLRRDAHTLKGAARVVRLPRIAELAHAVEDRLAPYISGESPVPADQVSEMLRQLDPIALELKGLDAPAAGAAAGSPPEGANSPQRPPPTYPASAGSLERVRVEIGEMEALGQRVYEASSHLERMRAAVAANRELQRSLAALAGQILTHAEKHPGDLSIGRRLREQMDALRISMERPRYAVSAPLEAALREFARLRENLDRMRLLPAAVLFPAMERTARDAAQALGKLVEFSGIGGAHRLEGRVVSALGEALLHLVRNAVAHGIENPADRSAAGKPAAGRIRVAVARRGDRILLGCSDDGRGIDFEAVRRALAQRRVVSAEAASRLSRDELIEFLFQPGVTTLPAATQVAGRGIGLDVVRNITLQLKGRVAIRTEPGRGTTVEIDVPLSLSSMQAVLVEAAGVTAWIPLEAVRATLRIAENDVIASADRRSIAYGERTIPLLPLGALLGGPSARRAGKGALSAVIIESRSGLLAAGVDRILNVGYAVVHPLPAAIKDPQILSGAALDAQGNPRLVLDPEALIAAALRAHQAPPQVAPQPPRILAIDDSLTSRMLEKSILEGAGCAVDVAASGEEGLARALRNHYAAFVCDIEMPGMDGFEFLARAREYEKLRGIPTIMVTTRTGAQDRERAAALGAQAYLAKSEFDEKLLLEFVKRLVAQP